MKKRRYITGKKRQRIINNLWGQIKYTFGCILIKNSWGPYSKKQPNFDLYPYWIDSVYYELGLYTLTGSELHRARYNISKSWFTGQGLKRLGSLWYRLEKSMCVNERLRMKHHANLKFVLNIVNYDNVLNEPVTKYRKAF